MFAHYHWSLPLLSKELLEQAVRRRTYVIRLVYVSALCIAAFAILESATTGFDSLAIIGHGREVLKLLVELQFCGIYLFLPAAACGVFTVEKERNTLGLLFLTRLGPWTIVLEKFLSRLAPMLCLLLCSLPVYAFGYALGGITTYDLFCAVWFLLLASVQVACVAVMCSSFAHSTKAAFLQTYFLLAGINGCLLFVDNILLPARITNFSAFVTPYIANVFSPRWEPIDANLYLYSFSPVLLYGELQHSGSTNVLLRQSVFFAVFFSIPALLSCLICLVVARICLYRCASTKSWNPFRILRQSVDFILSGSLRKPALSTPSVPPGVSTLDQDPIAWREKTKGLLGRFQNFILVLILMELPVLWVAGCLVISYSRNLLLQDFYLPTYPVVLLWSVGTLIILATATSVFPRERNEQTLDVLLVTPIKGRDLILQKLRGIRRMQVLCAIPLLSAILVHAWWRQNLCDLAASNPANTNFVFRSSNLVDGYFWWEYLFGAITSLVLLFELVKWISVWSGLMIRSSIRALVTAMALLIAYCTIPLAVLARFESHGRGIWPDGALVKWDYLLCIDCSPFLFQMGNEGFARIRFVSEVPLILASFNILIQGTVILLLRRHILIHADWYLGRGPYRIAASVARNVEPFDAQLSVIEEGATASANNKSGLNIDSTGVLR